MSLLAKHFEKLAAAEAENKSVLSGIWFDVVGTLIKDDNDLTHITPVLDFAHWNAERKLFTPQIIFSSDKWAATQLLKTAKLSLRTLGRRRVREKEDVYKIVRPLSQSATMLELVIDDEPTPDCLPFILSHWNPRDPEVRAFFERQEYKNFTPA